jgi:hypothetical protein
MKIISLYKNQRLVLLTTAISVRKFNTAHIKARHNTSYLTIFIYPFPCSVVGILTVRGLNPGRGEVFRTRPDRHWGPSDFQYNGYRVSIQGVKRPEAWG